MKQECTNVSNWFKKNLRKQQKAFLSNFYSWSVLCPQPFLATLGPEPRLGHVARNIGVSLDGKIQPQYIYIMCKNSAFSTLSFCFGCTLTQMVGPNYACCVSQKIHLFGLTRNVV